MVTAVSTRQGMTEAIYVDEAPMLIGNCELASIRLDDESVAEFHCSLSLVNDKLYVRDLGSGHNTELNGYCIRESVVFPGDRLTLGRLRFDVDYTRSNGAPPQDVVLVTSSD